MYIEFNKINISKLLPEKRPEIAFSNPDLFIMFNEPIRFVLWDEIINRLPSNWLMDKDLWETEFDFGRHVDDYEKQFNDYKTIELMQFPKMNDINVEEKDPFIFDEKGRLYISEKFIDDLKSVNCIDIWYDTTAPFGRY